MPADRRTPIFTNNVDDHEWTPMTCSVDNPGAPVPLPGGEQRSVAAASATVRRDAVEDNPCTEGTTFADAMLMPLGDNGGPTPTMMPASGSVVIGAGAECPDHDQRGEPRPTDGCAAGAVEP